MYLDAEFIFLIAISSLSLISGLLVTFRMVFIPKRDVIEIHENIVKIGISLYTTVLYFLFLYIHSYYVIVEFIINQKFYIEIPLILIAILPSIFIIYGYFYIPKSFSKKFNLKKPKGILSQNDLEDLESYAKKISGNLGLKYKPNILISEYNNISPFVFGKTLKKSFLSIPANLKEIISKITYHSLTKGNALKNFLILHELSHIKHRDHIFICWSYSVLRTFKYWIIAILAYGIVLFTFLGATDLRKSFGPALLGIVYYFVLYLLTLSVSRNREYLSDARASLFIPENELESITKKRIDFKGRKISQLEFLIHWFGVFSDITPRLVGISEVFKKTKEKISESIEKIKEGRVKRKIVNIFRYFFCSHPEPSERVRILKVKKFIEEEINILSKESSVWTGIILGLLVTIANFYPIQIEDFLMKTDVDIWYLTTSLGMIFSDLYIFFIPVLFYTVLRNTTKITISYKKYLGILAGRFLIIYISCFITSLLLSSIFFLGDEFYRFPRFIDLIRLSAYYPIEIFIFSFLFTLILTGWQFYISEIFSGLSVSELRKAITYYAFVFGTLILLIIFLKFVINLSILSIMAGMIVSLMIALYFVFKFPIIFKWYEQWGMVGNPKFVKTYDKRKAKILFLFQILISFHLPITIIAIMLYYVYPINEALIALFYFFFILFIIRYRKFFHPSFCDVTLFVKNISRYLIILRILDSIITDEDRNIINNTISKYEIDGGSYKHHMTLNIGTMSATYYAILSLHYLGLTNRGKNLHEWILKCENSNGGFSPVPELKSRLSSTYEALFIAEKFNMLEYVNKDLHTSWIISLQNLDGYFSDSICKYTKLQQTFYAVNVLSALNKIDKIDKRKCGQWLFKAWKEGRKDCESTFYLVKCLELLGELNNEIKNEIRNKWILQKLDRLLTLKVAKYLPDFYYYIKTAEITSGYDKEYIKNLIPNLEKRAYNSFVSYIKKS